MSAFETTQVALNISPNLAIILSAADGNILFRNASFDQWFKEHGIDSSYFNSFGKLKMRAASFGKYFSWTDVLNQPEDGRYFQMNVNLADDNVHVFRCRIAPMTMDGATYYLLIANDITLQWQLSKKIALKDSSIERIISEFPVMICALDTDGFIKIWNHRAAELTGYSAHDMMDNPQALSLLFPNQRYRYEILDKWNRRDDNVIRNWNMEITCKNGSIKHFAWTVRYRENPIIEGINHWAIGIDITKEVISLQALQLSEQKFKLLSRSTNDALWDLDIQSGELWWSEGMTNLFGYNLDEVEPNLAWWEDKIHSDYRSIVANRFQEFIKGGKPTWSDEYKFRRSNGSFAYVLDKGYILYDNNGTPIRAIGGMTDLTNEKVLEHLLAVRENQLKEQLENGTHRLKPPLSKVMQIAKLLAIMRHDRQDVKELCDQLLRSVHDLEVAIGTNDDDDEDEDE